MNFKQNIILILLISLTTACGGGERIKNYQLSFNKAVITTPITKKEPLFAQDLSVSSNKSTLAITNGKKIELFSRVPTDDVKEWEYKSTIQGNDDLFNIEMDADGEFLFIKKSEKDSTWSIYHKQNDIWDDKSKLELDNHESSYVLNVKKDWLTLPLKKNNEWHSAIYNKNNLTLSWDADSNTSNTVSALDGYLPISTQISTDGKTLATAYLCNKSANKCTKSKIVVYKKDNNNNWEKTQTIEKDMVVKDEKNFEEYHRNTGSLSVDLSRDGDVLAIQFQSIVKDQKIGLSEVELYRYGANKYEFDTQKSLSKLHEPVSEKYTAQSITQIDLSEDGEHLAMTVTTIRKLKTSTPDQLVVCIPAKLYVYEYTSNEWKQKTNINFLPGNNYMHRVSFFEKDKSLLIGSSLKELHKNQDIPYIGYLKIK